MLPPPFSLSLPPPIPKQQYDGYMAAVPSKHDLASLVRSIHAEIALAVPAGIFSTSSAVGGMGGGGRFQGEDQESGGGGGGGGGTAEADMSLAPLLLKGVSRAMKLLCAKVEIMHSVDEVGKYRVGLKTKYTRNKRNKSLLFGGGGGDLQLSIAIPEGRI